jgi:large subunit ribosomal protein L20
VLICIGSMARSFGERKLWMFVKGFVGRTNRCRILAYRGATKALLNSYIGRKQKKRNMRKLWISRIGAGSREYGLKYGVFMHGLALDNVSLNRKSLSELAMSEPLSFKALVDRVKQMRSSA